MKGALRAFVVLVSCLFFPIPDASAQDGNTTIQVAYTEWFPYTYTENGQAKGFEIETTRAVFARMGFRPEFSAYPWKRCLANLENGKSALVVSLLKTREREEYTIYPEEHISVSRTVFAARKDHVPDYAGDLAALRGMRVGVIMGFSYGPALDRSEFLEKDPAVDTASLIGKLIAGRDGLIAEVDRSGRTGGRLTVRAPIGGVVQTLNARAGVTLASGQTLAEISGLGTVWLNAALPEAQAGLVKIGQPATANLTAFPGEAFTGRVVAILPTAAADSRTLTVRIELANRGGRLRPGMFAVVALGGDAKPTLLVPSEAVIRTGTRSIVMLEKGDGRYHPAEVVAGREGGGKTEILQGLAPGEKVVASGQFLLDSEASLTGLTVRPLEAAQ